MSTDASAAIAAPEVVKAQPQGMRKNGKLSRI
jgi:hypothetical protein